MVETATAEFTFTPEQEELRRSVRAFLQGCAGLAQDEVWRRLGTELGVLGLAVPEQLGGPGGGLLDQAIVVEEFGAELVAGPVVGTIGLAIPALTAVADRQLLPSLLDGSRTASLALPHVGSRAELRVTESDGRLTGEIPQVIDGTAEFLLVLARGEAGPGLWVTDGGRRTPLATLDVSREQAHVQLQDTSARLLATGAAAEQAVDAALAVGAMLLTVAQVGGAARMLHETVTHARTRVQFGRAIGSFQAVKHRCVDLLIEVEHSRSMAYHAAWALQDGIDDPDLAVSMAQAICSEAYQRVAAGAIQVHGGIGFTWEHVAHRHLKRAWTDAAVFGSPAAHRSRVAAMVLDDAPCARTVPVADGHIHGGGHRC